MKLEMHSPSVSWFGDEHVLVHPVDERVAVDVTGHAAGRPAPVLGDVGVEQLALRVGAVGARARSCSLASQGASGRRSAGDRRVELDRHVGDAGLPVLGGGVLRVELVAGRVVADRADDAAVPRVDAVSARRVVGVHAPVHAAAEADDVAGR